MKDLVKAKELLKAENLTLAIVKDGECIYKSQERGIYPLYCAWKALGQELKKTVAADKVIGKGAALFYAYMGIGSIYAEIVSESALSVLELYQIPIEYKKRVVRIENRDRTGSCPVETLAQDIQDLDDIEEAVKQFLIKIKKIQPE